MLRARVARRGLHEEEVAHFVDEPAAEAEIPVDGVQRRAYFEDHEPGLLPYFAKGGRFRFFARLQVSLGEPPVLVAIADEEKKRAAVAHAIHPPPRRRFDLRPVAAHATGAATMLSTSSVRVARP